MSGSFTEIFLEESVSLIKKLDAASIEALARGLGSVRDGGGRLFILGVGGSAGHPHAENVIVIIGSGGETVEQTAEWLNAHGERVGVLKVHLFRPFSIQAVCP